MINHIIKEVLESCQISIFGICPYPETSTFLPCRQAHRLPEDPKSVIVCLFPYYTGEHPGANVSRYARIKDYHQICGFFLKHACDQLTHRLGGSFCWFCDISPLPERLLALRAGVGVLGKNHLIIHPIYGSYVFIGEIVTDRYLIPSEPSSGGCLGCGACEKHCPQGCLTTNPPALDKCLSFISQKKGELSEKEQQAIQQSGMMWGCDRCQEVCPHNRKVPMTPFEAFSSDIEPIIRTENLMDLMENRAFGYRGKKVLKRNLQLITLDE